VDNSAEGERGRGKLSLRGMSARLTPADDYLLYLAGSEKNTANISEPYFVFSSIQIFLKIEFYTR